MIIGITGKMGSGKDTIGKIIQYLIVKTRENSIIATEGVYSPTSLEDFEAFCKCDTDNLSNWQIVKYADALKDIICILTGCTREQLEDTDFKNSHLPDEWKQDIESTKAITYRKLLQKLGTDLLRNQLHENVWVNALFSKYKPEYKFNDGSKATVENWHNTKFPNWIITDCRFPNEAKAIKDRDGISIRVNRIIGKRVYIISNEQPFKNWYGIVESYNGNDFYNVINNIDDVTLVHKNQITLQDEHTSETALDNTRFDYTIDNNGTIEELIKKVKEILIKEHII